MGTVENGHGRWNAQIGKNGTRTALGTFDLRWQAARAYDVAMRWYVVHGYDFSRGRLPKYNFSVDEIDDDALARLTFSQLVNGLKKIGNQQSKTKLMRAVSAPV